ENMQVCYPTTPAQYFHVQRRDQEAVTCYDTDTGQQWRRRKDLLRRGVDRVDPTPERSAASGQRLATGAAPLGHALFARPTHRRLLAADRRTRRRLPRLLLLPRQPRRQRQVGRRFVAAIGRTRYLPGPTPALCH